MKIAIIGAGYVGLTTGACLAELGNEVICSDIDQRKINLLNVGEIPIYEPGLKELVRLNVKEKRLFFTTKIAPAIQKSEIVFNTVGTPLTPQGDNDLSAVYSVVDVFKKNLNNYKIFVNKSTVPIGISQKIKKTILSHVKNRKLFDVVNNPEFLREGTAIKDFMKPDRIIVGVDNKRSEAIMKRLYVPLVRASQPLIFTDLKSAEMIKYVSNAFLALKISFINEIANFCDKVNGDIKEIARGIGMDHRIGSRFLHAGIGWGGSCLPKDVETLINLGKKYNFTFKIIKAAHEVNEQQKYRVIDKLKKEFLNLRNKIIAVWGLSFKPKTDDIRESPAIAIIKQLQKLGATIQAFDPAAMLNAKSALKNNPIVYAGTSYEALNKADALLILTEWDEFRSVDFNKMKTLMRGRLIIDGRNIYNPQEIKRLGFTYYGIGYK